MITKKLQLQKNIKKTKQKKNATIVEIVYEIMIENFNKNKKLKFLQTIINMIAKNLIVVFAFYVRFSKQQLNKIFNNERIQNVINETQFSFAINIQHHSKYAFQNVKTQQQIMNIFAIYETFSVSQQRINNY